MAALDQLRLNLAAALSPAAPPADRTAAERWLSAAAAASPGYCDALLALIAGAEREDPGTRFLAAVQLKNVVAKRWRETGGGGSSGALLRAGGVAAPASSSSFSDLDRARLRPLLLSWLLSEPHGGIATIAAVAVSKVARQDWPSSWPELLPELANAAATATATAATTETTATGGGRGGGKRMLRARLGLASVLKELSSKRLSSDVRAFRALAAAGASENGSSSSDAGQQQQQLLPLLWQTFLTETRALLNLSSSSSSSSSREAFDSWALVLKSVRVLLVSGFSETEGNSSVGGSSGPRAVAAVAAALPPLSEACAALCAQPRGKRAALKVIKAIRMIAETHPWSLVASGAAPAAVRVATAAISSRSGKYDNDKDGEDHDDGDDDDDGGRATTADRVVVQSCLLIKAALAAVQDATPPPRQQHQYGGSCDGGGGSGYNSASSSQRGGHGHGGGGGGGGGGDRLSSARSSVAASLPAAREALSGPALASLADALVSEQLRLRLPRRPGQGGGGDDLSLWEEDPEAWALSAESGAAAWRDSRRGAAEALLSAAVAAEREALAPRLAQGLRDACARFDEAASRAALAPSPCSPSPSPAALAALVEAALNKEAAAAAATVASYELHDHVAFSSWLAGDLARDLEAAVAAVAASSGGPSLLSAAAAAASAAASPPPRPLALLPRPVAAALARRACLAIAAWVPKATREDRMRCYPPLISALAGGESGGGGGGICDAAVALAAATALRSLVDDWDFSEEDFAPLAGAAFAAAARALGGADGGGGGGAGAAASLLSDADSHVQVFGLVGIIVDRLPPGSVAAHAPSLMQFLPAVWAGGGVIGSTGSAAAAGGASSMLRVQCVSLLSRLLLSLGDESPAAYPALLPMLSECLSESPQPAGGGGGGGGGAPPTAADLVEDGLGLWLVALRTAPQAWGGPRARPLVAAGCAAAAQALERTSATALAPLAAAGAGSAALLSCVFLSSADGGSSSSSDASSAAAVEFASLPEAKRLCDRLALAAGEASERASMALVASADLIFASITSSSSSASSSPPPPPGSLRQAAAAAQAALALLQESLVRLAASVLRGKEGPAVAGGVAALVARVVLAGEEGGGEGAAGGGGAALAALASAAAAAAAVNVANAVHAAAPPPPLPTPPSLALIDLMLERAPSLPSGARKGIALALAAVLASPRALPTEALFASVAGANPATAPWSSSAVSSTSSILRDRQASSAAAAVAAPHTPSPISRPLLPAIAELLVAAVEEFDGAVGSAENGAAAAAAAAAAGVTAHGDAENDDDEGEQLPLRFLFDSSMAEAAAVGAAGGDCSALSESVDAEGEAQRRAVLRRRGAVAATRVGRAIAAGVSAAAASRGVEAWGASLAALDPRVAGALRAAAERGAV